MEKYDVGTIRLYVNDKDGDIFSDDEIRKVADAAGCMWCAISELWTLRSLKVDLDGATGGGGYSVGMESYKEATPKDIVAIAKEHAKYFKDKCTCGQNGGGTQARRVVFCARVPYIDD